MKNKVSCVIDFGQSYLKFNLITGKYEVARTLIKKNNFKIFRNRFSFYDGLKIEKIIKSYIIKISKTYNITSIVPISHGSACFFLNKDNEIKNGFHFSSIYNNKKILKSYNKSLPKFNETFTPNYKNFHNLGKNIFIANTEADNL